MIITIAGQKKQVLITATVKQGKAGIDYRNCEVRGKQVLITTYKCADKQIL